jgi:hypothetical protein
VSWLLASNQFSGFDAANQGTPIIWAWAEEHWRRYAAIELSRTVEKWPKLPIGVAEHCGEKRPLPMP